MRRYSELVGEIGELQSFPDIRLAPPKSARLKIVFGEQSWWHRFTLDSSTTDVKRLLARKFVGLPASAFAVDFHDVGSMFGPEPMKYPKRSLRRYGGKDGDELHVRLTVSGKG